MNETTAEDAGTTTTRSDAENLLVTTPPASQTGDDMKHQAAVSFVESSSSLSSDEERRHSTGDNTHKRHSRHLERIHHAKHVVQTRTHQVLRKTHSTIETSRWCLPLKWCFHFPRHWPRTSSFVLGVVVPLWVLIACSTALGVVLAGYESPPEILANDQILAARAQLSFAYNTSAIELLDITNYCLEEYWTNQGPLGVVNFGNTTNDWVPVNRTDMQRVLDECTTSFTPQVQGLQSSLQNISTLAFESLTFNWNRCWPYGSQAVFYPSQQMKIAARPDNQEAYFQQEWQQMQEDLYVTLRPINATPEEDRQAYLASIEQATGDAACVTNQDGTAWFFFTIMTTVGTYSFRMSCHMPKRNS